MQDFFPFLYENKKENKTSNLLYLELDNIDYYQKENNNKEEEKQIIIEIL